MPKTSESRLPIPTCCAELPPPMSWESQTRKRPSASSLWARSSQKEAHIKTQLPPLCWTPDGSDHTRRLTIGPVTPVISRQHHTSSPSAQGIAASWFEWGMAHLVKPKSPPDRDWMGQGFTQKLGYTDDAQTVCESGDDWTENETPAGLPHTATPVYPWRPVRVQSPS